MAIINKTTSGPIEVDVPENIISDVSYDEAVEAALKGVIYTNRFAFSLRMFLIAEVDLAHKNGYQITRELLNGFIETIEQQGLKLVPSDQKEQTQ